MPCAIKNCKIKSNISTRTGLCSSCDSCFSGIARRMERHDRQSHARDNQHAQNRGDGVGDESGHDGAGSSSDNSGGPLPKVDLGQLINSHNTMENGSNIDGRRC